MKCSHCNKEISMVAILFSRYDSIICKSCGAVGKASGRYLSLLVSTVIFIPISSLLTENEWLSLLIIILAGIVTYVIAFYLLVRISWEKSVDQKE